MSETDKNVPSVWDLLKDPWDPRKIHWRVGNRTKDKKKGAMLAYIDARDVMKRLDDVLGPENWQDEYITEPPRKVRKWDRDSKEHYYEEICGRVICRLSIRIPAHLGGSGEWIAKSDGAGETQVEAEKGAISDAFKRAAVKFGVGRYLYMLGTPWVELDQYGKPPKGWTPDNLPQWAYPRFTGGQQ